MKIFLALLTLCSLPAFADICICQYPEEDAKFGMGRQGEIGFYKMGCALWLMRESYCRREKIVNINIPLEPYLSKALLGNEKVRIGFVGHWESSMEYVDYLRADIEPLLQKFQVPFEINNTACYAMNDPEFVQDYLNTVSSSGNAYIKVEGAQTASIGMWDKVLIHRQKADLVAFADSRKKTPAYPYCKEFLNRNCSTYQDRESGSCAETDGSLSNLICQKSIGERNVRKWIYKKGTLRLYSKVDS